MQLQNRFHPRRMGMFTLLAGILALVLTLLQHRTGFDDRNLLTAGHWTTVLLFLLTAVEMGSLLLFTRPLEPLSYRKLFPASLPGAVGCWVAAAGMAVSGVSTLLTQEPLVTVPNLLGKIAAVVLPAVSWLVVIGAAAAMVMAGLCRLQGKRPAYWLYALATLYGVFHMISQYQTWSSQTQLPLYFFSLMASTCCMLAFYHHTCLAAKKGSRRWYTFFHQATVFFCCASIADSQWLLYLTLALWAVTNQPTPLPVQNPEAPPQESPAAEV